MIVGIDAQPQIYISKQPTNICQLQIYNTITDDEPEYNKPCDKQRCKDDKHINTATNVFINHKTIKPGNYNYDTAKLVYVIHC